GAIATYYDQRHFICRISLRILDGLVSGAEIFIKDFNSNLFLFAHHPDKKEFETQYLKNSKRRTRKYSCRLHL
ncbi:MAG: hypothetical protein RLZZ535_1765, partial [Cyanobacteriota bacterium]